MYLRLLHGFPKDLIRDVNSLKKLGLKCVDWKKSDVIETATGRVVTQLDELTFKGNIFQRHFAQIFDLTKVVRLWADLDFLWKSNLLPKRRSSFPHLPTKNDDESEPRKGFSLGTLLKSLI